MNQRTPFAIALAASLAFAGASVASPPEHKGAGHKEVVMTADQMQFKEVMPGVSKATLWGDPAKGSYAAITRFSKGFKTPMHHHSRNVKLVVISGTFVYDSGSGEQRLGPGSYLFETKGVKHTSGAGDDADCVFMEELDGPFDMIEAK
jgi:quercetin dioxygenase-like cupin family protein